MHNGCLVVKLFSYAMISVTSQHIACGVRPFQRGQRRPADDQLCPPHQAWLPPPYLSLVPPRTTGPAGAALRCQCTCHTQVHTSSEMPHSSVPKCEIQYSALVPVHTTILTSSYVAQAVPIATIYIQWNLLIPTLLNRNTCLIRTTFKSPGIIQLSTVIVKFLLIMKIFWWSPGVHINEVAL